MLLVIGAMAYVKERLPWHLPKVWIMVGMMVLLIYGWVFYTDGIPEDPRARVVWALLVSLPLILVVMGVHTMWIFRRRG